MSLTREQDEFITALYKEMFKKLVNIGYELLGNVTLAEEVAQEAFLIRYQLKQCSRKHITGRSHSAIDIQHLHI